MFTSVDLGQRYTSPIQRCIPLDVSVKPLAWYDRLVSYHVHVLGVIQIPALFGRTSQKL